MSEQTKNRKTFYLKMTSLVTGLLVTVLGALWFLNCNLDEHTLLIFLGFVALGILTIRIACLARFKIGIILGTIEVLFFASIFFPFAFMLGMASVEKEMCDDQMRSLSSVCQQYCEQNEGTLPCADTWCDQLCESVETADNDHRIHDLYRHGYHGYSDKKMSPYAFNKKLDGYRLTDVDRKTVLLFKSELGWNQNGTSEILAPYGHQVSSYFSEGGYNFVFVGPGSTFTVEFVKYSELDSRLNWEPTD